MTPASPHAAHLLRLIQQQGVRFGMERSFRLSAGQVLPNRFLVSLARASLAPDEPARVLDLCRQLDLPDPFLAPLASHLPAARFLHFGHEEDSTGCLYKVYLELGIPRNRPDPLAPLLQHIAFKWDPLQPARSATTRYLWHPSLPIDAILHRISAIHPAAAQIMQDLLHHTPGRIRPELLRYMEVSEDSTPRRSFDLNLYDAGLALRDVHPLLQRMCDACAVPPASLNTIYPSIQSSALGHIAGGIHRDGALFFNVYYGVEARQG